ncbi:hypothetical protein BCD48_38430 [Pseudofrankia sp. BMG5.36]|nr:hypothetical protein BCD48_38430 [Pseudofrankia sp. BMG5.36]
MITGGTGVLTPLGPTDRRAVGNYRLRGRLGTGGMGTVFLGVDDDGQPAAVKVIRSDLLDEPQFRDRFRREVTAARRVRICRVAHVLDADPDADEPWMATEYVEGTNLLTAVTQHGPLRGANLTALATGLAEGLVAVHAAGVVHRDLKPANILLAREGPKIIDFGLARADDLTANTSSGSVIGTVAWMAPEQLNGDPATTATDIFNWGMCVAFAARAHHPFEGQTPAATAMRILSTQPGLDGMPADLLPMVTAALDRDPGRRPGAIGLLTALATPRRASPTEAGAARPPLADWIPPAAMPPRGAPGDPASAPASRGSAAPVAMASDTRDGGAQAAGFKQTPLAAATAVAVADAEDDAGGPAVAAASAVSTAAGAAVTPPSVARDQTDPCSASDHASSDHAASDHAAPAPGAAGLDAPDGGGSDADHGDSDSGSGHAAPASYRSRDTTAPRRGAWPRSVAEADAAVPVADWDDAAPALRQPAGEPAAASQDDAHDLAPPNGPTAGAPSATARHRPRRRRLPLLLALLAVLLLASTALSHSLLRDDHRDETAGGSPRAAGAGAGSAAGAAPDTGLASAVRSAPAPGASDGPGGPTASAAPGATGSASPLAGTAGPAAGVDPATLPRAATTGRPLDETAASRTTVLGNDGAAIPAYRGPSTGGLFGGQLGTVPSGSPVDVYCGLYAQQVSGTTSTSRLWVYTGSGWIPAGYIQTGSAEPVSPPACVGTVSSPTLGSNAPQPDTGPFPLTQDVSILRVAGKADSSLTSGRLRKAEPIGQLHGGDLVVLRCQASVKDTGEVWDQLTSGGWIQHTHVYSGTSGSPAPAC